MPKQLTLNALDNFLFKLNELRERVGEYEDGDDEAIDDRISAALCSLEDAQRELEKIQEECIGIKL